jgi:hypothetical protein
VFGLFGSRFAFVLFCSGAWLHWALRLAQQAQEPIRRVANQMRLVVLRAAAFQAARHYSLRVRHPITGYSGSSICPYSFQIPNLQ